MYLEKQDLVTLTDDKEYVVLTTLELNGVSYVYLIEEINISNIKFCIQEMEGSRLKLIEVENTELCRDLLKRFTDKLKKELDEQ